MFACLLKKALPWSITFWTILGRAHRFSTRKDDEWRLFDALAIAGVTPDDATEADE